LIARKYINYEKKYIVLILEMIDVIGKSNSENVIEYVNTNITTMIIGNRLKIKIEHFLSL
jgi:hypothetical protein